MTLERRIEAALQEHLLADGWTVNTGQGDHIAEWFESDHAGGGSIISINLTELAKSVVAELVPCN